MSEIAIRQVRSANGASTRQRETLRSLQLGRIGLATKRPDSPQLRGMLRVVGHLVEVDGAAGGGGAAGGAS